MVNGVSLVAVPASAGDTGPRRAWEGWELPFAVMTGTIYRGKYPGVRPAVSCRRQQAGWGTDPEL